MEGDFLVMIINEPIYDLNILAKYNLHIHTTYSSCAKPEMTISNILETAKNSKLEVIVNVKYFFTIFGQ